MWKPRGRNAQLTWKRQGGPRRHKEHTRSGEEPFSGGSSGGAGRGSSGSKGQEEGRAAVRQRCWRDRRSCWEQDGARFRCVASHQGLQRFYSQTVMWSVC